MHEVTKVFYYDKIPSATWFYLSSLLMIGLFFKFSRLWSVRNLDLLGLVLLAPGLLLVQLARFNPQVEGSSSVEQYGYIWLFSVAGLFMIRLLLDPMMVRRPLLEPNLSVGGLSFLGISFTVFMLANVLTGKPSTEDLAGPIGAARMSGDRTAASDGATAETPSTTDDNGAPQPTTANEALDRHGPGYALLSMLPTIVTQRVTSDRRSSSGPGSATAGASGNSSDSEDQEKRHVNYVTAARIIAVLSQLAIILGMVAIGYRHFDNVKTGIAAAVLYLMLPYTHWMAGASMHLLPAALLIWAVEAYRRPLIAGMLMGLAIGVDYFPVFLLPLWCSFYWQRGLLRFLSGIFTTLAVLVIVLAFNSHGYPEFLANVQRMFGWTIPRMNQGTFEGFWKFHDPVYRITVLAAIVTFCSSLALWPAQKNLGTLMSCSAAVMLGTQFWHPHGGGLYMAWYLPLLLLTIFRPNLEDRVALSVLGSGWMPRRLTIFRGDRAA